MNPQRTSSHSIWLLGIAAALIIGLAAGNISQPLVDTVSGEGAVLQAKITNLQDQIDGLTQESLQSQHELNTAEATVKQLLAQLDQTAHDKQQLEKEISNLKQSQEQTSTAEAALKEVSSRLNQTKLEKQRLEKQLLNLNQLLGNQSQEQTNADWTVVKDLRTRLNEATLDKQYLAEQVATMNVTVSDTVQKLEAKKAELAKTQDELQTEKNLNEQLRSQAASTQKALQQLQAAKTLLAELKNDVPTERSKLKEYWENIKPLAAKVDQTLGRKVDNITVNITGYMDWTESAPSKDAKPEAWGLWLLNPTREAAYYLKAVDDFQHEAYSAIMRDIEAAKNTQ
ncbi:MAG: hypothetical protein M1503_11030 [Thaumarchaeota archaeon]|nr:hypothetical protein [Nitrososphaerota archaeon]